MKIAAERRRSIGMADRAWTADHRPDSMIAASKAADSGPSRPTPTGISRTLPSFKIRPRSIVDLLDRAPLACWISAPVVALGSTVAPPLGLARRRTWLQTPSNSWLAPALPGACSPSWSGRPGSSRAGQYRSACSGVKRQARYGHVQQIARPGCRLQVPHPLQDAEQRIGDASGLRVAPASGL